MSAIKTLSEENQSLPCPQYGGSQGTLEYTKGSEEAVRTSIFDSEFSAFIC